MKKINILHLSDMHFGVVPDEDHTTTAVQRRDSVIMTLVSKLDEISKTNLKPDIIVISGDIGWKAKQSDYLLAEQWINKILQSTKLTWNKVIICPGNHDISRDKLTDECVITDIDNSKKKLAIENVSTRSLHFKEYIDFCRNNGIVPYINSALDSNNDIKYLYGYRVINDICFMSWNSAWNCRGKDLGNLYVGEPLVLDMKLNIPKDKFVISVLHHPFFWLNENEHILYNYEPVAADGIVDMSNMIFNGHIHGRINKATHYQNKAYIFTSGAVYDKDNYHLGCQIIQIDLEKNTYTTNTINCDLINLDWKLNLLEKDIDITKKETTYYTQVIQKSIIGSSCIKTHDISLGTKSAVKHFVGRNQDIKSITNIFYNNKHNREKISLWIYSMGGMGKTQLCRKLFHEFNGKTKYIGWVTCTGDFKTSLLNSIHLKTTTKNADKAYRQCLDHINRLGKNLVLFIDNLDVLDQGLNDIELLKCHVIVSSRNKNPDTFTSYELGKIPFRSCKALFQEFYKIDFDNYYMNEIIHKTGYLTLAIELLAKTGQKMGIKLETFYNKLAKKGFDIKTVIESNWDNSGERLNLEISKHFEKVFDLSQVTKNAESIYILSNISLFPYLSINQSKIIEWLHLDEENNLLSELNDSGWLECTNCEYSMHPVISFTIKKYHKPTYEECSFLVSEMGKQIQIVDSFLDSLMYLPYATSIGRYFKNKKFWNLTSSEPLALLFIRVSEIFRNNGEYSNALNWAETSEQIWHYSDQSYRLLINTICNTMSEIYLDMRDKNTDCEYWALRAISEDEKSDTIDDFSRSVSYHNLGSAYIQLEQNEKALEWQIKAVELRKKCCITKESKTRLANSYRNLAMIYRRMGKETLSLAEEYQLKVINILENVYSENPTHPDLPVAYSIYSFILRDKGKIEKAIEFQNKAVDIREKNNKNDPKLAINYNNMAMFLLENNNPKRAKKWMEKAIDMDLKNRAQNHIDIAVDLFNYSKILFKLNQKEDAIACLEKSRSIEALYNHFDRVTEIDELIKQYNSEDYDK